MYSAWMSQKMDHDRIRCLACNHNCIIPKGKCGICGVRKNVDGNLYLNVYANPIAVNVDPIEKKPLYHFLPSSKIFSIGTVGCNFRCSFCQNWDISQFHKKNKVNGIAQKDFLPENLVKNLVKQGINLIAYTYNEPAIFFEYAYDIAKEAKKYNFRNVYVSNGYETIKAMNKIKSYLDAINIDLKSFRNSFYGKYCGASLKPVLENIKWCVENNIWLEVTTLVITDLNDSKQELKSIANFLAKLSPDIPWHISRYYPCYKISNSPTSPEKLHEAFEIGKEAGLKYVYIGNIEIDGTGNTYCPLCQKLVIKRNGFKAENKLQNNKCYNCGYEISGIFN